jgi:hypothetical protein
MPERIPFPEFRDELEFTRYPFGDTATLTNDVVSIGVDTFLDATLYPIGAVGRVYLGRISVTAQEVTLYLYDEEGTRWASASFTPGTAPDLLYFTDDWGRPAGVIVSEAIRLARFGAWPVGEQVFSMEQTEFVSSCIIPLPEPGVRGVLSEKDELFTGDLWIVGDNGVVVRKEDERTIRVDIVGDPLYVRKLCEQVERFVPPLFIKTINHCPPDPYGNFHLIVGDYHNETTIVRIYPTDANTLRIEAVGQVIKEGQ